MHSNGKVWQCEDGIRNGKDRHGNAKQSGGMVENRRAMAGMRTDLRENGEAVDGNSKAVLGLAVA